MTDVQIQGIHLIDKDPPWDNGEQPLALFTCIVRGIKMLDCILFKSRKGIPLAQAPRGQSKQMGARIFQIVDIDLRHELADAAYESYKSFGGKK